MDWREHWEEDARAEYDQFCELTLEVLLDRVRRKKLGSHHMIWDAIAAKGDLRAAAWPLFDFASSRAPYLDRYHCASALLTLLQSTKYQASDLAVEHLKPAAALADVSTIIKSRVGPRRDAV
jgi:hypothetical protein